MAEPRVDTSAAKPEKAVRRGAPLPIRPFADLRRGMDRLFADFDRGGLWLPFRPVVFETAPLGAAPWPLAAEPAVDIVETENAYRLSAELPGLEARDIDIRLVDGGLTIKGSKSAEKKEKQASCYLHERHFGSFERCFRVPAGVDTAKIEAVLKSGVLTLTLPKTPEARKAEKKIEIKAS